MRRHAVIGFGLGCAFVGAATWLEIWWSGLPFGFGSLVRVQARASSLWIVDVAPLVFAAYGVVVGSGRDRVDRLASKLSSLYDGTRNQLSTTIEEMDARGARHAEADARVRRLEGVWSVVRTTVPAMQHGDPDRIEEAIEQALQRLGQTARAGRAYLFRVFDEAGFMNNTHEWCAPGVESHLDDLQQVPLTAFPWTVGILRRDEVVQVSSASVIPVASNERESIEAQGIRAMLIVPVVRDGRLLGFAGLDDTLRERPWDPELKDALRILGATSLAALARKAQGAAGVA